ncbi:hypothetical protein TrRE_jg11059, partial [Triparma retinervis]
MAMIFYRVILEPSPSTIRALLPTPPILQSEDPLWTLTAPSMAINTLTQAVL